MSPKSGSRLDADFAIGADGARSNVRASLEIPLEGPRTQNAFVIVDAAEDPDAPLPPERIFHYEHPAVDGRNVLFVPFAGHWRIDLQCRPDDDAEAFGGEGVKDWLPLVIDAKYAERVTWVSTYVFMQVLAREFADPTRRVLLVGEAAHLFAPFGARGLNSGIPDAIVAAARRPGRARCSDRRRGARRGRPLRRVPPRRRRAEPVGLERGARPPRPDRRTPHSNDAEPLRPPRRPTRRRAGGSTRRPYGPRLGPADSDGMQY